MKLEDIKNMSDEEFITFIHDLCKNYKVREYKIEKKAYKTLLNINSILPGCAMGCIFADKVASLSDDTWVIVSAAIAGGVLSTGIFKILLNNITMKTTHTKHQKNINNIINLKRIIENTSKNEFQYSVNLLQENKTFVLTAKIQDNFVNISISDSLNNTKSESNNYVDEENDLGYSKTMNKND